MTKTYFVVLLSFHNIEHLYQTPSKFTHFASMEDLIKQVNLEPGDKVFHCTESFSADEIKWRKV